jgi:hypothetical protein
MEIIFYYRALQAVSDSVTGASPRQGRMTVGRGTATKDACAKDCVGEQMERRCRSHERAARATRIRTHVTSWNVHSRLIVASSVLS